MADLLRQGTAWLEQQRAAHAASPVTYRRGQDSYTVDATFGRTQYEVEEETSGGGLRVGAQVTDFLISAETFPLTEPEAGDQIVADGRVYEVMAFGQDLRGWRWSDPYRTTLRIHTKDIGAET